KKNLIAVALGILVLTVLVHVISAMQSPEKQRAETCEGISSAIADTRSALAELRYSSTVSDERSKLLARMSGLVSQYEASGCVSE
ncbi:MAG: hypothetical protein L0Y56_01855, partial [Nitrospira sp.]|nr:hypothetical protein [Nitrospira sp.]